MSARSHVRASAPSPSSRLVSRLEQRASQDDLHLPPARQSSKRSFDSDSSSRLPSLSPPHSPTSRPTTSSSDSVLVSPPRQTLFATRPRKVSRKKYGPAIQDAGTCERRVYPVTAQDHKSHFTKACNDADLELPGVEQMSSLFRGLSALAEFDHSSPEVSRPRYPELDDDEPFSTSGSSGHRGSPLPYNTSPPLCPPSRHCSVFESALPIFSLDDPMIESNRVGEEILDFVPRRPTLRVMVTEGEGEIDAEWRDAMGAWEVDTSLDMRPVIVEGMVGLGLGGF
ncbi:MAG: hypothetical protein TREMPRED_005351 [Tremellales sp. Tagirdzhanova-0007]|nr:MAG: hypothetical protein TREMPRED_005351 [Tremellales sp. Tagirdzhanova-0007]